MSEPFRYLYHHGVRRDHTLPPLSPRRPPRCATRALARLLLFGVAHCRGRHARGVALGSVAGAHARRGKEQGDGLHARSARRRRGVAAADASEGGTMIPRAIDPNCPGCANGTCLYGVRYRSLRRTLARSGTRGRRNARPSTPPAEQCPWCARVVPAGVSWCPECGDAIRFKMVGDWSLGEDGEG